MSGPVPNRSEDLARPRERKGGDQTPVTKGVAKPVTIPRPDESWHEIARMIWDSLALSGQSDYFQQSDWAYAYHICEELSTYKGRGEGGRYGRNGQILASIDAAMSRLLLTEGDRRRVRLELEAPPDPSPSAGVVALEDYRQGLRLVPPLPETP